MTDKGSLMIVFFTFIFGAMVGVIFNEIYMHPPTMMPLTHCSHCPCLDEVCSYSDGDVSIIGCEVVNKYLSWVFEEKSVYYELIDCIQELDGCKEKYWRECPECPECPDCIVYDSPINWTAYYMNWSRSNWSFIEPDFGPIYVSKQGRDVSAELSCADGCASFLEYEMVCHEWDGGKSPFEQCVGECIYDGWRNCTYFCRGLPSATRDCGFNIKIESVRGDSPYNTCMQQCLCGEDNDMDGGEP